MPICEVRGLLKRKFCGCYQSLDGTLDEGGLDAGTDAITAGRNRIVPKGPRRSIFRSRHSHLLYIGEPVIEPR